MALLPYKPFAGTLTTSNLLLSCYSHIHARDVPLAGSIGPLTLRYAGNVDVEHVFVLSLSVSILHYS